MVDYVCMYVCLCDTPVYYRVTVNGMWQRIYNIATRGTSIPFEQPHINMPTFRTVEK